MHKSERDALSGEMQQHRGLITPRRAKGIGLASHKLRSAHGSGELVRVRQRVYRGRGTVADWLDELAADLEACWRVAYASHSAALAVHGLRHPALPLRRELVVHGSARPTVTSNVIVHRTRRLEEWDLTEINGIPVTTAERALIDVAGRLGVAALLELLDDAVMGGVVNREVLYGRGQDLRRGRAGVSTLVAATKPAAEDAFKSRLEQKGLPLLLAAGARDLQVNVVPLRAPAAGLTDVVSEIDKLVVDWDGLRFHSSRRARQRDNEKANQCALGGYTALRFTWSHVTRQEHYVVGTTRRVLEARPPAI